MKALVLVGMSVSDVDRRELLAAEAHRRSATLAFLQMGDPSLSAELTRLSDAGATTITLVGVNTGPLGPGHSWLRRIAAHWWRERAGLKPELLVVNELVTAFDQLDAVLPAEPDPGSGSAPPETVLIQAKPITGAEPGLTSAAWEDVTSHRHQVMICRGPRCTAKGAEENVRAMILAMLKHQLGDSDVLLVHTGCQFPCNQAPVISVQPDDVWYGHVDPATVTEIVDSHFVQARPLESHRLPREGSG